MIALDLAGAVVLLSLLFVHGRGQVWLIYTVTLVYGAVGCLFYSAQSAYLTRLLPAELLGDANAVLQTTGEGMRLIAPLVGAGLFAAFGGPAVAALDAATFVVVGGAAWPRSASASAGRCRPSTTSARRWRPGSRHIARSPGLRRIVHDDRRSCCSSSASPRRSSSRSSSTACTARRVLRRPQLGPGRRRGRRRRRRRRRCCAATATAASSALGMLLFAVGEASLPRPQRRPSCWSGSRSRVPASRGRSSATSRPSSCARPAELQGRVNSAADVARRRAPDALDRARRGAGRRRRLPGADRRHVGRDRACGAYLATAHLPPPTDGLVPAADGSVSSRRMQSLTHHLQTFIAAHGLEAVFVLMVLESACIPVPSEVTMIYAGYLVSQGSMSFVAAVVVGARGEPGRVADRVGGGRLRRRCVCSCAPSTTAAGSSRRTAGSSATATPAVFFARLLPVVRTFISLPAGVARMPLGRFSVLTVAGLAAVVHHARRGRRRRRRATGTPGTAGSAIWTTSSWPPRSPLVAWLVLRQTARNPATRVAGMPVPLMDIRGQYADLLDEVKRAVCDVIDSGRFILGPNMRALEEEVASAVGAGHGVAVANGTDALVLSLEALGIGRGDEVVTTAYTFYATAEAIARVGATPVFADIDPRTFNLDSGGGRGRGDRAHARDRRRAPLRAARRPAGAARGRRPARPGADRGRRPGVRRHASTAAAPGASATWPRSRSSPPRTSPRSATPAWSSPAAPTWPSACGCCASTARARSAGSSSSATNSRMDEIQAAVLRRFLPEVGGWNAARRAAADRYRAARPRRPGRAAGRGRRAPSTSTTCTSCARRPATQLARSLPRAGIGCRAYYDVAAPPAAGVRPPRLPAGATCPRPSARPTRAWRCRCSRRSTRPASARSWRRCARRRSRPPSGRRACASGSTSPTRRTSSSSPRSCGACATRGWDVAVTARAFAQTLELLELHGIEHTVIGHHGGGSRAGKARAAADRVAAMVAFGRRGRFDVAPRPRLDRPADGLPRRCASPTRRCSTTSTRRSSTRSTAGWRRACSCPMRSRRRGCAASAPARRSSCATRASRRSTTWPASSPTPRCPRALGLDGARIGVVLRPPADVALYHRFENPLFDEVLERLGPRDDVRRRGPAAHARAGGAHPRARAARGGRCPSARSTATAWSRAPTSWSAPAAR